MIIILGKSKKLVDAITQQHKTSEVMVISWRDITSEFENIDGLVDEIYVIGFDFSTYMGSFSNCVSKNVEMPWDLIYSIWQKNQCSIVYVNTMWPKVGITYSRYAYCKTALALRIQTIACARVVALPTIVGKNSWPLINASFLEKIIIYVIIRTKKIEVIKKEELSNKILIDTDEPFEPNRIEGKLLWLPRPSIVDKALRILFG